MPKIDDPQKLFAHKLSKIYASEREILNILKQTQKEANDRELASGFEHHAQETEQQIQNLDRVFEALGERPEDANPSVVKALRSEHDQFAKQGPPAQLLDAFLASAAATVEHFEISAYEGLITMASAMGEDDVVALLSENLEQEQHTLREVQAAGQKLAQQLVGTTA
jgi:ferritin-like metal-binding protein YciE